MAERFPAIFVSHGAPTLPIEQSPAQQFISGLGSLLGKPTAILVVSAHWESGEAAISSAVRPETIYDFFGFPQELYRMVYPAPGAPELASRVSGLLKQKGIATQLHPARGLDHGAWVPLLLMYPEADIPVLQLSVQPELGPEHHLAMGRALQQLSSEGVLVIGSGSFTHNLAELRLRASGLSDPEPAWVDAFAEWVNEALADGRIDDVVDYRRLAPFARNNHPSEEHFLPLF